MDDVGVSKMEVGQAARGSSKVLQDAPHVPLKKRLVFVGGVQKGVTETVLTLLQQDLLVLQKACLRGGGHYYYYYYCYYYYCYCYYAYYYFY